MKNIKECIKMEKLLRNYTDEELLLIKNEEEKNISKAPAGIFDLNLSNRILGVLGYKFREVGDQ